MTQHHQSQSLKRNTGIVRAMCFIVLLFVLIFEVRAEAEKDEFRNLFGKEVYLDTETLSAQDSNSWLRIARDGNSYFPSKKAELELDGGFHADVAFWCIKKGMQDEAYLLFSLGTDEVQVFAGKSGQMHIMSLELKQSVQSILRKYFDKSLGVSFLCTRTMSKEDEHNRLRKLMKDADHFRNDPVIRKKEADVLIELQFGPILNQFGLEPGLRKSCIDLLVLRHLSQFAALDDLNNSMTIDKNVRKKALSEAIASFDSEIIAKLTPENAAIMRRAMEADYFLSTVNLNEAVECKQFGHPLSASQCVALAWEQYNAFDPDQNQKAKDRFTLPLNAFSLTELEESLLHNLNGVLDQDQLFILRNRYASIQRSVRLQ